MLFNSYAFAIFLPIVFIIYWILPHKFRWVLMLAASYYFYMSWNAKYIFLIFFTTVISYIAARLLENEESKKKKKIILALTALVCLGVLFFFKYFNFVSKSVADVLGLFAIRMSPITLKLLLPVGISFYTFQTLSYVIDVYKGEVQAEHHFGYYATFISFFPQLVAGPIERTGNLLPQIKSEHKFDYNQATYGLKLMAWGFLKKLAIADVVSIYVDKVYADLWSCSEIDLLSAIFFFTMQIYCDFSGYSDIAVGTAKLLGIDLISNFKSPYMSLSVKEFWSRWHISLSSWFKDYVYIPLGGNRVSKLRNYFNLLITFLVSGLWHGANWTYVIWGGIHGIAQIAEKAFDLVDKGKNAKVTKFIKWIIVFTFCNIAWVFFRADSLKDAIIVFYRMIGGASGVNIFTHQIINMPKEQWLIIFLLIGVLTIYDYLSLRVDVIQKVSEKPVILRWMLYVLLVVGTIFIHATMGAGNETFVYFQF